jgi:AcrR family transcriptional regulator
MTRKRQRRQRTEPQRQAPANRARERGKPTPLASILGPDRRATPVDLLKLATGKWLRGERLDVKQLADELGVSRATAFRWIGSRELLYGEVLSHVYASEYRRILGGARGRGIVRLVHVTRETLRALHRAAPLRTFIEQDPEFAIRVLASKSSPVQARSVELEKAFLRDVIAEAGLRPQLDIETLAFLVIRICESFLYADVISGRTPDIEKAVAAIRILVAAEKPTARDRSGPRRSSRGPARTR